MLYPRVITIGVTLLLSACSDSNNDSSDKKTTTLPQLSGLKVSTAALSKASTQQFTTHLKNGLFMRHYEYATPTNSGEVSADAAVSNSQFSSTNVQEQGVDEADRIKYDGQYMYVSANTAQSLTSSEQYRQFIRIIKRDEAGGLTQVSDVTSSNTQYQKQQLFLNNNTLAVLNHDIGWFSVSSPMVQTQEVANTSIMAPTAQQFELSLMDVSIPEQASVKAHYTIDGQLIDTRVINNQLYIVSNYYPQFDGFVGTDNSEQSKLADYQALQNEQINKLLPAIKNNLNSQSNPLFSSDNCYINEGATTNDGYDAIMTLTKISLTDPTQQSSICVNTYVDGLYASQQSLYAYSTDYTDDEINSVIHKFSLTGNALDYSATGKVTGHFGWRNQNLRFSEVQQYLRVVTSSGNTTDGLNHTLFTLEQQGNELAVLSQLPNDQQPTPIGKVNSKGIVDEDIYAVRFTDSRAYVVTFKQTDPLYVIDLSNVQMPNIAGALEIPGYSSYLHPISDSLLLGVGQHVDDLSDDTPVITQGAKVSLFDISNINNPQQVSEHIFDNAYSAVESNYHAFSFLPLENGLYRFTLPIETWHTDSSDPVTSIWAKDNALAAFELNTNTIQMNYMGSSMISYPDNENIPYIWSGDDRAIIHQDDLYYFHGNYIWQSDWLTPAKNTGPH
ncbi:hypothetical protein PSECIP111854_03058 [Pseudoalteromonas sp. CIP111854]|uniref:Beta-propeller domain-containing protein n=1 Tax=Pseudoalteromonas holothuriae TaxID=2963714 RepID=A0A9W4R0K9_9GAMM|nr:beta-propeller domain-containing protein [Pseudoalteromonas sp. CIP111854]CAH9062660.1 hypothetical protein PSECIP111854_03058 [Pseudoalteromonas sp. CIP111854]